MDLDEGARFIELDQVAIAARLQLGARWAGRRRRRVQRVLDADVVIGMDRDVFPERYVVGDAVIRPQVRAFFGNWTGQPIAVELNPPPRDTVAGAS